MVGINNFKSTSCNVQNIPKEENMGHLLVFFSACCVLLRAGIIASMKSQKVVLL